MSRPDNSSNNHDEEPPPYTEIAENGNSSLGQGAGVDTIRRFDVQTTRPTNISNSEHTGSPGSLSLHSYEPPNAPPPNQRPSAASLVRPPAGPPPGADSKHKFSPPSGPPPSSSGKPSPAMPQRPPGTTGYHPPPQQHYVPPGPPPARPQLRYPKNYFCQKCHNTGLKVRKGTTCQDCFERFGVRSQAQYLPPGAMPIFNAPPRIVQPGDPSIGGWLCGRCRGAGIIRDFFLFESQCPICHGVGRVF